MRKDRVTEWSRRILGGACYKYIRRHVNRETKNKWRLQMNPDVTALTSMESHFVSTQPSLPALASYAIPQKQLNML